MPSTSLKEPLVSVPGATQEGGPSLVNHGLTRGRVDASALGAAIEHHRSESQRLAKAAEHHRNELRVLLRERDQHIVQLQASGWQLARIASLYKVTKARIAQITKSIRLAGEDAMAVSCQGGDAR